MTDRHLTNNFNSNHEVYFTSYSKGPPPNSNTNHTNVCIYKRICNIALIPATRNGSSKYLVVPYTAKMA